MIKGSGVELPAVPCRFGSYKVTLGILGLSRKGKGKGGGKIFPHVLSAGNNWPGWERREVLCL